VSSRSTRLCTVVAALGLIFWLVSAALAVPCAVPSTSYPTIGAAVRDGACTLVQVAAGSFPENVVITRDLAVAGAGSAASSLHGTFTISGAGNDVTLNSLLVDGTASGVAGCWSEMLKATGGATITSGSDVKVLQTAAGGTTCRLFADGFESGGALAWSARVP
jgi:hypothetical protein